MRLLLAVGASAVALWAQYGTGTIVGTVTDSSGLVVPHAEITLSHLQTNAKRSFFTDDAGNFRFPALLSGVYRLTAKAPSFKTSTIPELILQVNSEVRADLALEVGTVQQEVQVQAIAPQLQPGTATVGT